MSIHLHFIVLDWLIIIQLASMFTLINSRIFSQPNDSSIGYKPLTLELARSLTNKSTYGCSADLTSDDFRSVCTLPSDNHFYDHKRPSSWAFYQVSNKYEHIWWYDIHIFYQRTFRLLFGIRPIVHLHQVVNQLVLDHLTMELVLLPCIRPIHG